MKKHAIKSAPVQNEHFVTGCSLMSFHGMCISHT